MADTSLTQIVIRAKDETAQGIASVQAGLKNLERSAGAVGAVMSRLAVFTSVAAFSAGVKGAIDFAASLDDVAAATGSSVENLSALADVAKVGGHDFNQVTTQMGKLTKALHGTDEESKKAKAGLQAIGLTMADLKGKDPSQQLLTIAQAMDKFADGPEKSAVAMALFGKQGQLLIPFLQDLAEKGELNASVTTKQSAEAEKLQKQMAAMSLEHEKFSRQVAAEVVPALLRLTEGFTTADEGGQSLAGLVGNGLRVAFETMAVLAAEVVYVFKSAGRELGGMAAQIAALAKLDFKGFTFIGEQMKKDAEAAAIAQKKLTDNILGVGEAAKKTQEIVEKPKSGSSGKNEEATSAAKAQAEAYKKLIDGLKEKIAIEKAAAESQDKLTSGQRDYVKYQADIANGNLRLSASQRAVSEALFKTWIEQEKLNKQRDDAKKAQTFIDDYRKNAGQEIERINRASELALMTERQRTIAQALYKVEDDGAKLRERIIRDIQDETAQREALLQVETEIATQKQKVEEATGKSFDAQRTFEFGWQKAFNRYKDEAQDAARMGEELFTRAADGMTDALTQFVMTGKLDFKSLVNSIIADIARIQIKKSISSVFENILPSLGKALFSANGNAFTSQGHVAFANGGAFGNGEILTQPTAFRFASGGAFRTGVAGEAGPEAAVPLKRLSNGKLGVYADGMGGAPVTVNVINNANGAQASAQQRTDSSGQTIIDVVIEQVKGSLARDVTTGGVFAQTLEYTYGMNRAAGAWR